MKTTPLPPADAFTKLVAIVARLRDPSGGCPWDLKQNHHSLRPYLIEECYEVLEALEAENDQEFCEELGDLILQVVLHAQLATERDAFTISEVLQQIADKLVRRHPHVFGDTQVSGAEEVLRNWERIKIDERIEANEEKKRSTLSGIPRALPALLRAQRMGEKAAKVSFDWPSAEGVWAKVDEELAELREVALVPTPDRAALAHELGDILFALAQLARWLGLSAEDCLQESASRFSARFQQMEATAGRPLPEVSPEDLDALWESAKSALAATKNHGNKL